MAKQGPEAIPKAPIERRWFQVVLATGITVVSIGALAVGVKVRADLGDFFEGLGQGRPGAESGSDSHFNPDASVDGDVAEDAIVAAMEDAGLQVLGVDGSGSRNPNGPHEVLVMIQDAQQEYIERHGVSPGRALATVACSYVVRMDDGPTARGATAGRIASIGQNLAMSEPTSANPTGGRGPTETELTAAGNRCVNILKHSGDDVLFYNLEM